MLDSYRSGMVLIKLHTHEIDSKVQVSKRKPQLQAKPAEQAGVAFLHLLLWQLGSVVLLYSTSEWDRVCACDLFAVSRLQRLQKNTCIILLRLFICSICCVSHGRNKIASC